MNIAREAESIINGPRKQSYGPVEESFRRHAFVWTGILLPKLKEPITPEEVILMMIGLKVMREANARHRDNRVDIIGHNLLLDKLIEQHGLKHNLTAHRAGKKTLPRKRVHR